MEIGYHCCRPRRGRRLWPSESVDMAHKLSSGQIDSVADFARVFFPTLCNGLLSWQKQQSTTVDPADMREFIRSEDRTYRPDHGASRGAASLQARGLDIVLPLNDNEGSPKPSCSL